MERGGYKVDEGVCRDRGRCLPVLEFVLEFVELALGRAEIAPEELLLP